MDRRTFITRLTAACAAAAALPPARATDPVAAAFQEADAPWRIAYRSVGRERYGADVRLEGRWPEGLRGVFYRNGPGQHEVEGFRYRHWFDGDGLVQRFAVAGDRLQHRARLIDTAKRQREASLGRAAYPTFGSLPPDPAGVARADDLNPGNISLLDIQGRLFALWEAGSPWQLDPDDLRTIGLHSFSRETAGLPFSAHPRVDPDGTVWNFGYASDAGKIVLWHLDRTGAVVRVGTVDAAPTGMPHDFVVTERYLVLVLAPLHRDHDGSAEEGFLGLHRWHPERPTRLLVVSKGDFALAREFELPAQWIFHFGNGFDDGKQVIRFDAARHDDPSIMLDTFRAVMRGRWTPVRHARWFEYTLDLATGRAREAPALDGALGVEFPRVSPREVSRRHERVLLLAGEGPVAHSPGALAEVACWHRRGDRLDRYRYPASEMVEEHVLVPDSGSDPSRGGWVIGTTLDLARDATTLNVFRADDLAAGPVASARLPYALPLGLHGWFVPTTA